MRGLRAVLVNRAAPRAGLYAGGHFDLFFLTKSNAVIKNGRCRRLYLGASQHLRNTNYSCLVQCLPEWRERRAPRKRFFWLERFASKVFPGPPTLFQFFFFRQFGFILI